MPFFTIVIPTLNEQGYIKKLLSDLREQIDKNYEVIVVDGFSEDKTIEQVSEFKKFFPIKAVTSQKRNVSIQRNIGAKLSKGKWIVFFDADIRIPPNFLSHLHAEIIKNSNIKLLTTWMDPDSNKKSDGALITTANLIIEMTRITDKPMLGGACILVRKDVFRKIKGFNQNLKMSEDHDLAERLKMIGVNLNVCRSVKYTASLRRFRREGTIEVLRKYALATSAMLFSGPVYQELFEYQMGGKVKIERKKMRLGTIIKRQIKKIEQILG